ncbi:hypothetical protein EV383_4397 [Pseudonocardia sediminis]|uniref:Terminase small subunit n=1 Tax=Pseudonocardia sediminis TaxID=1397368 RepID=A0A4Q7UZB3_PSEST|nr:hypothetical protein [Pseudonocardia sediminis]RZT87472.1 hypothetical protein EV383_4397 [Pseudonocardia sediminis]
MGGARNRSGPQPDPTSGRSDRRGLSLTALPAEGFTGETPDFPLPDLADREREVWEQAWRTPQAAAWAAEPWRQRTVAMWVRWSVRMEASDASAALGNVVVRFADQIGLTPAGLKENGWKVAADVVSEKRATAKKPTATARPRSRFKVVNGDDAG